MLFYLGFGGMKTYERLLLQNRAWAGETKDTAPGYFESLAKDQKPEILWIGCSDSRVPAEIIVNAQPGEIFAHRNIANQVIATDFDSLSVIQYAVQVLKVSHVIVCGHYNCGGIKAALKPQNPNLSILNEWLMHLKDTHRIYRKELDSCLNEDERANRLSELNVIEQVKRISHLSIIQSSWIKNQKPFLHGWIYSLNDGILQQLCTISPESEVDEIYREAV